MVGADPAGIMFRHNVFSRRVFPGCGYCGPVAYLDDTAGQPAGRGHMGGRRQPGPPGPTGGTERVRLSPVDSSDLPEVGRFLGSHMPPDTAVGEWAEVWRRSINVPGRVAAPNHGFLLRHDGEIVGVYLAIYSERTIDGRRERFCNLAEWYVLPDYRLHSLRLLKALLGQGGLHYTDLAPSPAVRRLNLRFGFQELDTTTAVVPNLPWPSWPGRTVISADPAFIEATLAGQDRLFYRDHASSVWARHVVLTQGGDSCYVLFRKERRKRLRVFANILYVSNPILFRRAFRTLAGHLLVRHGAFATLAEVRVVGGRLRPSALLANHRHRMFRSESLGPEQIDYLYSELTSVP